MEKMNWKIALTIYDDEKTVSEQSSFNQKNELINDLIQVPFYAL